MQHTGRYALLAACVLALAIGAAGGASAATPKPIPPSATMLTQEQIGAQRLEFSFGGAPPGPCGYVPNVVPPQISGNTALGDTVTTWPGQWNPCSPPLVAVDVYWPGDGSHGTTHVVTAADQAAGQVCSQSTVWDSAGDVGGPLTACVAVPQPPPPPTCEITETQPPSIAGSTSVGSTLTANGGSWRPSCGGGLRAADIAWSPDGSHSATYVVAPTDQGRSVCATVTVWDYNGASARDTACVAIPAAPPPPPPTDTTPPVVTLTAPADGAVIFDSVDVAATATDNVGVAGVQFKLDGNNLGPEDTAAPYTARWDVTKSAVGAHSLTAVARDAAGNRTTSPAVTATASNSVTDGAGPSVTVTGQLRLSTICVSTTTSAVDAPGATCTGDAWCQGRNRAWGTAVAPELTYENRLTHLPYWKVRVAVDVCIDAARHDVLAFGHAVVTPLYALPLVWSYDNSPRWAFGPVGPGVKSTWAQVTDGFTGCPWRLPIGCNHVGFTVRFLVYGTGAYSYSTRFP